MKKCVNLDGKVYQSNGKFENKKTLYSTQGEQIYQSGLKVDVQVQMRGALRCAKHLLDTEEDLAISLREIPKFQIGSVHKDREGTTPTVNTQNAKSFVVGVKSMTEAVKHSTRIGRITESIRERFNNNDECLPTHPISGKPMTTTDLKALKEKVSSHNQSIKQGAEGQLVGAGLQKGTAEWSMHYGEIMGRNRIQVSEFSIRIRVVVRHNIFEEFSIANFVDDVDRCNYHIARNKKYSENRVYTVDLPVTSIDQLKACHKHLMEILNNLHDNEESFNTDSPVIYLGTEEDKTTEQSTNDASLSEIMGAAVTAGLLGNSNEDDIIAESLLESILSFADKPEVEESDGDKPKVPKRNTRSSGKNDRNS